uniref:COP1-interactive protein 1 n=1 Tax=Erigeron canadensis TaxID=72917 RepID=UPI001CB92F0A|nr:COP1-interactive protein 1 [Erigeron canadensis]
MFKSGRWKGQNKIKVMFQMQFQATQVPKMKGKGLMVSLIPGDIGKPVAKLDRVPIVDGTCTWEDPIYEMVKLVKNQKTDTYKEKIYYFNVQTGSSKSGYVGEVGVDFANFAESTEPFQLSLPLTTSNSGAILHVFIQKMQRTDENREFEENESLQSESVKSKNQKSDSSENGNMLDFAEDEYLSKNDSRANRDSKLENKPNFQENSAVRKNSKPPNKKGEQQRSSPDDWSLGSLSDRSMADLINSPEQNYQNQTHNGYNEVSKTLVEVLRSDISRLERQAELSELEIGSLRKQIQKENKRGQDLSRKVDELREEKEALEKECDLLKSSQKRNYNAVSHPLESPEKLKALLDEMREELKHEKSLNKSLTSNLRKTEESNSELLEEVKDLDTIMEEKDTKISYLSQKLKESQTTKETMEGLYAEIELERKEKEELKIHIEDITQDYKFLLQENEDMSSKLENTQLEQMTMQNEYSNSLTTIKQYELQVKRLEEKIVNQALELSRSLDTTAEFETHIKDLEKELEKQGQDFEDDVADLMKVKIEQEERVVQAEEAFRKSKLANAATVENLQKALEKSNQELLMTKDAHEQEVQKLCDQIDRQAEKLKQMSLELETSKSHGENNCDSEEWIRERTILVTELNSLKKEAEKQHKESRSSTSLMSEKNVMIRTLQSELKMLRGDYNELQQRLSATDSEKAKLQKEVSRLETTSVDQQKQLSLFKKSKMTCDESKLIPESAKRFEGISSEKHNDEQKLKKLLSEISSLDEKNKHMESELKEMQDKYSEVSLRFAEVEGERQELVMALRNLRNGKKK